MPASKAPASKTSAPKPPSPGNSVPLEVLRKENELLRETLNAADASVGDLEAKLQQGGVGLLVGPLPVHHPSSSDWQLPLIWISWSFIDGSPPAWASGCMESVVNAPGGDSACVVQRTCPFKMHIFLESPSLISVRQP